MHISAPFPTVQERGKCVDALNTTLLQSTFNHLCPFTDFFVSLLPGARGGTVLAGTHKAQSCNQPIAHCKP